MSVILVVDDEPAVLELLRTLLEREGRTVLSAFDVSEALSVAAEQENIDVAVLDKNLKAGSGIELVRTLREAHPLLEAIIITAYSSMESAIEALRVEAFDYVTKPWDNNVLTAKVDAAEERALAKAKRQERLRHLYRMEAIGTLTASIGHEINNPLTYIVTNLEFLAERHQALRAHLPEKDQDEIAQVIEEAREGAERVRKIVWELRSFARSRVSRAGRVNIGDVLRSSVRLVENEIKHRARLVCDLQATPVVIADPLRLSQVFVNILANAAQALPDGRADDHRVEVKTHTNEAGWAQIEVRDTGAGVPEELRERVFDRFFTTKEVGEGTGLGLAISKRFLIEIGGEIEIDSRPGGGTVVRMQLPPAPVAEDVVTPLATNVADDVTGGRLLLIDDDDHVTRALERCLAGHEVVSVSTGHEALELLGRDRGFDLVLCDVMIPNVSGDEIHARLSSSDPALAKELVFMTGGAFSNRAQEFLARVPNRVLEKPLAIIELRRLLAERIQLRRG